MEILKIRNLSFSYPNKEIHALKDINLSISKGEFICLIGKSGCGKSTLLRHLKPVLTPNGKREGNIELFGRKITETDDAESASDVGFVMQNPDAQIVCDKVWHELAFGLENLGTPSGEIRSRVGEVASFFGMQTWFDAETSSLSGGQKQLLNLASIMVMNPKLLILDEPTSQLDPISAHEFLNIVHRINRELGTAVILSEQRLEEALPMSDRVLLMDKGSIIADTAPNKLHEIIMENKSPMLYAMPSAMRIFASTDTSGPSPLTVREGRTWLSDNYKEFKPLIHKEMNSKSKNVVLSAKDLWFRYDKNAPDVLKGFDLSLHQGELYALVGGNGSGKTTALSCISGQLQPYRGKVKISKGLKISYLPQNPDTLFVGKTVAEDIDDSISMISSDKSKYKDKAKNIIEFCELGRLMDSHPFDLSGGEKQRLALAKLLITSPDIILLDEPTKGLDGEFKHKLALKLRELQDKGISIIMISHDIEFCAKYADRVGMLFGGEIISEADSRNFFKGKDFYTTSANRIARGLIPDAVLSEDIIYAIDGKENEFISDSPNEKFAEIYTEELPYQKKPNEAKRSTSILNIALGFILALCFGAVQFLLIKNDYSTKDYLLQILAVLLLSLSVYFIIPSKKCRRTANHTYIIKDKKGINKRAILSALVIFISAPLTIYIGMAYFGDRKYYFISMMIIIETLLPFLFSANAKSTRSRELIIIAVLCAIAISGRVAFAALPQFKPICAIVIISGIAMGAESGFLVGCVSAFVSNFYFVQGPWTPWQMFCFGLVGFIAGLFANRGILKCGRVSLSIFGFLSTIIIYGGIMNPASVIMWQPNPTWEMIYLAYIQGLSTDLIHGFATAFFLYFASEPMIEKLDRVKLK